jgi:hypothetical protein
MVVLPGWVVKWGAGGALFAVLGLVVACRGHAGAAVVLVIVLWRGC